MDPTLEPEVPVGALSNETADNIDIKASEGEYVVPANVVRFLGLQKIESMVAKAEEQLQAMKQGGRIGGEPTMEEAPMMEEPMPEGDPGFAEGGMIAAPNQAASPTGVKKYVGPDGSTMYVPFLNGKPLYAIPEGYQEQASQNPATAKTMSRDTDAQNREGPGAGVKPVNEWNTEDFVRYGDQLGGMGEKLTKAVTMAVPGGGLIRKGMENFLQDTPERLDAMINSGLDAQGNPLGEDDIIKLSATREKIRDRIAGDTGEQANPFEPLKNFVSRIFGGGEQTATVSTSGVPEMTPDERKAKYSRDDPSRREGYYGQGAGTPEEARAVAQNILSTYDKNNTPASVPRPVARPTPANDDLEGISTSNVGFGPR